MTILSGLRYLLLAALLLPLQSCAFYYKADPIEAWVVDAETKQPLEGVVVVAHWQLKGGLEGGNPVGQMMVMETTTDAMGRFIFPGWGPKLRPISGVLKTASPRILMFKNGYEYRGLENKLTNKTLRGDLEMPLRSDWDGKKINMQLIRLTNKQAQYSNFLTFSKEIDSFATWYEDPCQWLNLPKTINRMLQIRSTFEADGIKSVWVRTLDQRLLEDGPFFIKKCGADAQKFIENLEK